MAEMLKNCPCCGSRAELMKSVRRYFEFYAVICSKCGLRTGDFNNKDDAVRTWNRRIKYK